MKTLFNKIYLWWNFRKLLKEANNIETIEEYTKRKHQDRLVDTTSTEPWND